MTQTVPPGAGPNNSKTANDREARLAEQLRANLHRRKAQARALTSGAPKTELPKT